MKIPRAVLLSLLLCCVCICEGVNADQSVDMYFHLSIQKYLEGNMDGAINDAEQAIRMGGASDKKLAVFYVKIMLERGSSLVSNKQYQDALPYFEKARNVDPENKEIKNVIELINHKLKFVETPVAPLAEKNIDKNITELIKVLQANQERLIEKLAQPGKAMETLVTKSDKERVELIKLLSKKDVVMMEAAKVQSESIKIIIYLLIAAIFVALFVFFITARSGGGKENTILRQQEAILNLMVQQQQALMQGSGMLRLSAGNTANGEFVTPLQMLNDPKARIRAKGVEIIGTQLEHENEDSEVAQRIIKPYLEDTDNRVRANAVKVLFRYNSEEALQTTLDMVSGQDKWMRVSGAWVLGEMEGSVKAAEMLMEKMADPDYHFKRRALKSLAKLVDPDTKKRLPAGKEKKVKSLISDISTKEQWIM